jgi:hypothetical protein
MDKDALDQALQEIARDLDETRLDELVKSLSPAEVQLYKTELTDAWLGIYEIWYYEFSCGKVTMEGWPDSFFSSQLYLLAEAEKISAPKIYHEERACCYQDWAKLKDTPGEQLFYIEKAIAELSTALQAELANSDLYHRMVSVLLDKIKINNQFTDDEFDLVLGYFDRALGLFTGDGVSSLLYYCFVILDLPFAKNQDWHTRFMNKLTAALQEAAEYDALIYLEWSHQLGRMLDFSFENIPPAYAQGLTKQSIDLLKPLTNFETDDPDNLNKLGAAFEKAAKKLSDQDPQAALRHYEVSLAYFVQAQDINPAAWTYTVYATNVLAAMAVIYHRQYDDEAVISMFEKGKFIFSKMIYQETDFTINLNWGRFLIEYARLAYAFDAPDILEEADEKLLIAQEQGQHYYDQPFIARAKVALKLGDRDKCLSILRECKAIFSQYHSYSLSKVLEDEDFAAIKQEITALDNP